MGETRVDLLRLLEDLRDAYTGTLEETTLTEIVANALDSGAAEVSMATDSAAGTLTVVDNGKGMGRRALTRYHDLAVTGKRRGRSIGFAGVGIKLGLLVCEEVVTETKTARARTALATSWRLASRTRAPWRWVEPRGLLHGSGTAVRLYLSNPLSQLLDPGFLEGGLLRHFRPLLDPAFDGILASQYPGGVRFRVNGRLLGRTAPGPGRAPLEVRVGRQRRASGAGYLVRNPDLAEEERGVAVSTLGKVIKTGWDWLGIRPPGSVDVGGLIEVPPLAESLTLTKADFLRSGPRGAAFLGYRKAIQEAVAMQLEAWGEGPEAGAPRRRRPRSLERDLQSVLADLSREYPLLATLVERRRGGQRRLPLGGEPSPRGLVPGPGLDVEPAAVTAEAEPDGAETAPLDREEREAHPAEVPREAAPPVAAIPGAGGRKKPARYGLRIRFESRPEDLSLGRLVESTVWVNDAHPAYRRALASRSEGYHLALTVAMALAALAVEPVQAQEFMTDFLARWGDVGPNGGRRRS
ncbi:MAG: ATP-binding protein [Candidatus Palauibacterales bacterium]|nr:ATP-binding protein [Candidatus Palauibacterales bacterium]